MGSGRKLGGIEAIVSAGVFLLVLAGVGATLDTLFSGLPPVFNQKMDQYRYLNIAAVIGLLGVAGVLASALVLGRLVDLARMILLGTVFLLSLEGLLCLFDNTVISVTGSRLASAFRNVHVGGDELYLPQPTAASPFGFRMPHPVPPTDDGYRLLFLGNSYVRGSGSSFATNYPQAVEADLRAAMPGRKITVFSAGVDGFGVKDDRILYEYLVSQGYRFDAVVMNIMMGSDPTNDIPGTIRRAIAGQPQRLHENLFVRLFYPFNTYIFRYAIYFYVTFTQNWADPEVAGAVPTSCTPSKNFTAFSRERAFYYYGKGAKGRLFLDYNMSELSKLGQTAAHDGTKLFVVLLPDPNGLLPSNRQFYAASPMDWDWTRRAVIGDVGGRWPVFDLAPDFLGQSAMFKCNDTHWNDAGNLAAAGRVAEFLAARINEPGAESRVGKLN